MLPLFFFFFLASFLEGMGLGKATRAHNVRKVASLMCFLRSNSIEELRRAGQCSSSLSMVNRYLLAFRKDPV